MRKNYTKYSFLVYFSVFAIGLTVFAGLSLALKVEGLRWLSVLLMFGQISLVVTIVAFFFNLSDFLVKVDGKGVCKGFSKDYLKWSQVVNVKVVDILGIRSTRKIIISSTAKRIDVKMFAFSSEEEIVDCIKTNLPWLSDLDFTSCPVEKNKPNYHPN